MNNTITNACIDYVLHHWTIIDVPDLQTHIASAVDWCKQLKSDGEFVRLGETTWAFKYEKDAVLFALKWS